MSNVHLFVLQALDIAIGKEKLFLSFTFFLLF